MEHPDPGPRRDRRRLLTSGPARWLVDGTNVVGSRPDGWWRDRPAAFAALVADLRTLVDRGDEVIVVFDGRPSADLAEGDVDGVAVRWARRRGRDAADDRIVELLGGDGLEPAGLTVVTSDRGLVARVEDLGASTMGAGRFRSLLGT